MFVARAHVHPDQFRACVQQHSRPRCIACLDGVGKLLYARSVDKRLKFGPTLVAIGARQHTLRVVQGKRRRIGVALKLSNFRDGIRIRGAKSLQQIFSLFSELLQVGMGRQTPCHDDLLSYCPVSA
jgi:hypothetical protein